MTLLINMKKGTEMVNVYVFDSINLSHISFSPGFRAQILFDLSDYSSQIRQALLGGQVL